MRLILGFGPLEKNLISKIISAQNLIYNITEIAKRIDQHIPSSSNQHCINRTASSAPPIGEPRPKYTLPGMPPSNGGRS